MQSSQVTPNVYTPTNIKLKKGIHIIADFSQCVTPNSLMLDEVMLREVCREFVFESGLNELNHLFHKFPDSGVTGVILLAESHFAIHTWPEKNYLTLDIFVCNFFSDNTHKARHLYNLLKEKFQPQVVSHHELERRIIIY